ncbi:methyltransferase domain-containing protein [uncultured Aquimarina sp.]|uniref:O-methyltransferase n=1 Tax=uncultured Aquimarina sp. TaxID=575652 RepID=UPI0026132E02|nr:methyltransferase domain-containing protein [uncultured Aquimarina sp.]
MNDLVVAYKPAIYNLIEEKSREIGFTMPSDLYVGSLLKTLISSKPKSNILELGTGIGLLLSWMIDGMDSESKLITIDNDPTLISIAQDFFGNDHRVSIVCEDGTKWLRTYKGNKFDLVFADAWPGKYSEIDKVLELIKIGGFYVVDDMSAQENWPDEHQKNVDQLIGYLEGREDIFLTKMNWSTGLVIAVKK